MDAVKGADGVVRIERGVADETEVAAVTVVLLSVLAARDAQMADQALAGAAEDTAVGRWQRWERGASFRAPHSWH